MNNDYIYYTYENLNNFIHYKGSNANWKSNKV